METKICKRCRQELPISAFGESTKKYVVGGYVKAVHSSVGNICKKCLHPPGWHLKYKKSNVFVLKEGN